MQRPGPANEHDRAALAPRRMAMLFSAAVFGLGCIPVARAQPRPPDVLADPERNVQVLTFFANKCSECHGSQVAEPEGEFGYILDLPRLIQERQVIPGEPDNSRLYRMLARGKMPPRDAKNGPAAPEEVDLVRRWIAGESGAPTAPPVAPRPKPLVLLGRLHVLVIHFPIGLMVAAALADAFAWRWPRQGLADARNFCAVLGALGAAAAAGLGWLNAWADHKSGEYLDLHRWLGTAAACIAVLAAIVVLTWHRPGAGRRALFARILLLAGAALIGVAAHFGGMMVYGGNYFFPQ